MHPLFDPIVSLAVSMQANPGVYALLVGSGLSRSAAIPTGWDIILDLIRKIAVATGNDCGAEPADWYRTTFSTEPSYSELVERLELSPTARTQLLREYFEPSPEDQEAGKKRPTAAHREIAVLVNRGFVRVIVTTNFDRLIEQALAEVGINPLVIATADAAIGMTPLAHNRVTVIKINGDYLDPRFRNTEQELAEYEEPLRALLDRVFDQYGLIVCGWSADWDIGLRGSLERCKSHRFTTYWTARGNPSESAQQIIRIRRAVELPIQDADSFFSALTGKVIAIEEMRVADPTSTAVAIAQLKRYLPEERHRIRLHDLVQGETERANRVVFDRKRLDQITGTVAHQLASRLQCYETATANLRGMVTAGVYFGGPEHHPLWCHALGRTATPPTLSSGVAAWVDIELYPGLLVLYAAGVAAVASGHYGVLISLLGTRVRTYQGGRQTVQQALNPDSIMKQDLAWQLPGMDKHFTPVSDHVLEVLREEMRSYIPPETTFEEIFEWFEYLRALVHWDAAGDTWSTPIGRFGWSLRRSDFLKEASDPEGGATSRVPDLLDAGLFAGDLARYRKAKASLDAWIPQVGFR